jgi:hypothetical protein
MVCGYIFHYKSNEDTRLFGIIILLFVQIFPNSAWFLLVMTGEITCIVTFETINEHWTYDLG